MKMNRFPCSIVWQPFPPLTWIIPMIGHTGICDSHGIVHDFQGPYYVEEGRMMLGKATRYLPLDPNKVRSSVEGNTAEERWDKCVDMGADDFRKKIHCLIYPNCNHHVAHTLNLMKYDGWNNYEMLQLWYIIFFRARFCGFKGFLISMGPFIVLGTILISLFLSGSWPFKKSN